MDGEALERCWESSGAGKGRAAHRGGWRKRGHQALGGEGGWMPLRVNSCSGQGSRPGAGEGPVPDCSAALVVIGATNRNASESQVSSAHWRQVVEGL